MINSVTLLVMSAELAKSVLSVHITAFNFMLLHVCPADLVLPGQMVARNSECRHSSVHVHVLLLVMYIVD